MPVVDPSIAIRPARDADVDGIGALHVDAWRWAYADQIPADHLASLDPERRAAMWRRIVGDPREVDPFVAVSDGSVVGFVHQGPSRDDDADASVGEVTAIYVSRDSVGTGVGFGLWSAALDQLRRSGHSTVTVWVLRSNERGRGFYERVGLRPDGATKPARIGDLALDELRYRGSIG